MWDVCQLWFAYKKVWLFLFPAVSVAVYSDTLFYFKLWVILKLEYGFTWIIFSGSSFNRKKDVIRFLCGSRTGNIFICGSSMVRWAEVRVWYKERPGKRMRPGQERQEKASHLSLPPISNVAWTSSITSLSLSFLICKMWLELPSFQGCYEN